MDSSTPTADHLEHLMAALKAMDCYLEQMTDSMTAKVDHLEHLMVPLKQKAGPRVPNWEPKIVTGYCWEPRKEPLTMMAHHLGRWKDSMIAKGYCWEPKMDSLTPTADHLGR